VCSVALASGGSAEALEREHRIGLGPSYAALKVDDKSTLSTGAGTALHYTYGATDMFDVLAEASWTDVALHQDQDNKDSPRTRPSQVSSLALGAAYVVDTALFTPYLGVMGGGTTLAGGTLDRNVTLGAGILAAGVDYRFVKFLSVGLAYRQYMFAARSSTYPSYSLFTAHLEYSFGGL
jgi:opacity protein-like surface antigen